jgi:phosphonate transport system substrate-binding protein
VSVLRFGIMAVLGVLTMALSVGCGDDDGGGEATANTGSGEVRFVVTELKGLEELQREFGAFQETFERESGLRLELFPVSSRSAAAAALEGDQADLVFTGPAEYVALKARADVKPVVAIRRPGYRTCIYTTDESSVRSLKELDGEAVAMEDAGSTSAHLEPSRMLRDAGVEADVKLVGDAMHEALKRGDVAAVGAGCHDFEEFTAEENRSDYRILAESPELPADIILARDGVSEDTIERVRTTFEKAWPQLREAMLEGEENAKFAEAELVAVPTDADYDDVREMYEAVGIDDYTRFIGEG